MVAGSDKNNSRGHPCLLMGAHDCGGSKKSALACGVFFLGVILAYILGIIISEFHELGVSH